MRPCYGPLFPARAKRAPPSAWKKGPTFMVVISAGHELCAQFRLPTLFCAIVCVAIATARCAHIVHQ